MSTALPPPLDVRLMNFTASVLFVALAFGSLAAGLWWVLRHPSFALSGITVQGDLNHNNEVTLRANVTPKLDGNFFTVDLVRTRAAFESVPWVRRALVQREFPSRLKVLLEEHEGVAYWGNERDSKLVNAFGEVFEANLGELASDDLPHLNGPQDQAALMLAMYRSLLPEYAGIDTGIETLELSGRGGWRVLLESGAVIEMGSGNVREVTDRVQRFLQTLPQVLAQQGRKTSDLQTADLRHNNAYAVKLRGVTTVSNESVKKK